MIPVHGCLLDFVIYVCYNDIIFSQLAQDIHFDSCQNNSKINSKL